VESIPGPGSYNMKGALLTSEGMMFSSQYHQYNATKFGKEKKGVFNVKGMSIRFIEFTQGQAIT
jgi:hypothetical protein